MLQHLAQGLFVAAQGQVQVAGVEVMAVRGAPAHRTGHGTARHSIGAAGAQTKCPQR